MIYLITEGSHSDYQVSGIMESQVELDLETLFSELKAKLPVQPDYDYSDGWEERSKKRHLDLESVIVTLVGKKVSVVECFMLLLVRDHGCKIVKTLEVNL